MFEIAIAFGLDLFLGDPSWLPHPVECMGRLIVAGEDFLRPRITNQRLAGLLLVVGLVSSVFVSVSVLVWGAHWLHPLLGVIVSIYLIFTALSLRSLEQAARRVYMHLIVHDLQGARQAVSRLVGRDTQSMDESEVTRATLESIGENSIDGLVAPFFYALLGGAPLALTYKAINTLDSMIGYANEEYLDFGWAAARLDDAANYIPARLGVILIPLAAGLKRMAGVLNIIGRDGRKHPSPNSGLAEAGFAAGLGVQVGGEDYYAGKLRARPLLGDKRREIGREDIPRAIKLLYRLATALLCLGAVLWLGFV